MLYLGGVIMFGALLLFEDEFIHVVSISYTALIFTEFIMVALTVTNWHWGMVVAEVGSIAIYLGEDKRSISICPCKNGLRYLIMFFRFPVRPPRLLRFGLHHDLQILVESERHHPDLLPPALHHQIPAEKAGAAFVRKTFVKKKFRKFFEVNSSISLH